mgnify:CR=1 FL=1
MQNGFGHERLLVYQKATAFVVLRRGLLDRVSRRVAACDHLERAGESIPLNIAHASGSWMPDERIVYLGHANGSALECAACLDVLVARALLTVHDVRAGKQELREIVNMLISMKETTSARVREEAPEYHAGTELVFSHERLDVYQIALDFIKWQEGVSGQLHCSGDLRAKMDKASTGIVLNIAEGNGRFSGTDHAKFLGLAHKATSQSAALLEACTTESVLAAGQMKDGMAMLHRIAAMLTGLSKAVSDHT